ncbi:MAG TPA: 50S ribosomal protein L11 methyltransferase [Gemmatimonadaceae bacterium]|nr:50S ribosomal protein L11 methyltransferase [Gemmatimonadaceae bacterium]
MRPSHALLHQAVSAAIFSAGALGVHEDGDWLVTHLEHAGDVSDLQRAVRAADARATIETGAVDSPDWSVAWRDGMPVHRLGRLTIAPPWLANVQDSATTVIVDPGMAFGTGDHPTTRGAIRLMQRVIRPGDTVADLGCGSGVLAIAAVKLGASRVAAIEMDHDAISNAEENVALNDAGARVTVLEGDAHVLLPLVAPVRMVLANIVSSVLVELLPVMAHSLTSDGVAILSGILTEESERMRWMLGLKGWRVLHEDQEDPWWSVCIAG